ncbi:MAG: helix-turn-helix domain-containing protein [bacterium]
MVVPGLLVQDSAGRPSADGEVTRRLAVVARILAEQPGCTIQEVALQLQCSHTTAAYHLSKMAAAGRVLQRREGRVVRHYLAGDETPAAWLRAFVAEPKRRELAVTLGGTERREWPVNKLARHIGMHHGWVMRSLRMLETQRFIVLIRPRARYYVQRTAALQQALQEAQTVRVVVEVVTDPS